MGNKVGQTYTVPAGGITGDARDWHNGMNLLTKGDFSHAEEIGGKEQQERNWLDFAIDTMIPGRIAKLDEQSHELILQRTELNLPEGEREALRAKRAADNALKRGTELAKVQKDDNGEDRLTAEDKADLDRLMAKSRGL